MPRLRPGYLPASLASLRQQKSPVKTAGLTLHKEISQRIKNPTKQLKECPNKGDKDNNAKNNHETIHHSLKNIDNYEDHYYTAKITNLYQNQ